MTPSNEDIENLEVRSVFLRRRLMQLERDRIIDLVLDGRMSPQQAEVEAVRLGLGPFERQPGKNDDAYHLAHSETEWSLSQALAWTMWRTVDAAVRLNEEFLAECWTWIPYDVRVPDGNGGARPVSGYRLSHLPARTIETFDFDPLAPETEPSSLADAKTELWGRLQSGDISVAAIGSDGISCIIPQWQWATLALIEAEGSALGVAALGSSAPAYQHLTFNKEQLLALTSQQPDYRSPKSGEPTLTQGERDVKVSYDALLAAGRLPNKGGSRNRAIADHMKALGKSPIGQRTMERAIAKFATKGDI